jgi:hypothetical protein
VGYQHPFNHKGTVRAGQLGRASVAKIFHRESSERLTTFREQSGFALAIWQTSQNRPNHPDIPSLLPSLLLSYRIFSKRKKFSELRGRELGQPGFARANDAAGNLFFMFDHFVNLIFERAATNKLVNLYIA